MLAWKPGPTLGTGNTIVLKPSGFIPLTALRVAYVIDEVGFPPGVVNILVGYGNTIGNAITHHMKIDKVAFTGSILNVTLELGGKCPDTIFDDADLEQVVNWAAFGTTVRRAVLGRVSLYDEFLKCFIEEARSIKVGDPFNPENFQGPQVSEIQFNRIMGYIQSGKDDGAKIEVGGDRKGTEGYFIHPTIFTDTSPDMKIVREEIFGPVGVITKLKDEEDVIRQANDTLYGLAAAVFTQDLNRAIKTAHRLQAGTVWVNCMNQLNSHVPFGGFKQSGIGRELGEYAFHKPCHINLAIKLYNTDAPKENEEARNPSTMMCIIFSYRLE